MKILKIFLWSIVKCVTSENAYRKSAGGNDAGSFHKSNQDLLSWSINLNYIHITLVPHQKKKKSPLCKVGYLVPTKSSFAVK